MLVSIRALPGVAMGLFRYNDFGQMYNSEWLNIGGWYDVEPHTTTKGLSFGGLNAEIYKMHVAVVMSDRTNTPKVNGSDGNSSHVTQSNRGLSFWSRMA